MTTTHAYTASLSGSPQRRSRSSIWSQISNGPQALRRSIKRSEKRQKGASKGFWLIAISLWSPAIFAAIRPLP